MYVLFSVLIGEVYCWLKVNISMFFGEMKLEKLVIKWRFMFG